MPRMSAFLCLRRGVSPSLHIHSRKPDFSLPTQRCFRGCPVLMEGGMLFSAYAEVFLILLLSEGFSVSFLCLRRGVSHRRSSCDFQKVFSLPTQRCFRYIHPATSYTVLFSAYAEVFPVLVVVVVVTLTFLCLRRGVSLWGLRPILSSQLFSAYAEVFPTSSTPYRGTRPFLCLRRGVSLAKAPAGVVSGFSLPTQRCFKTLNLYRTMCLLFSAYAEVFLGWLGRMTARCPFLCLRRGVS